MYAKYKFPFYIDVYDIPSEIEINGNHVYDFVLEQFSGFNIVPVIGLDRDPNHLTALKKHFPNPDYVAIRLVDDDLLNFSLTKIELQKIFSQFNADTYFDVILDNRLIHNKDPAVLALNCSKFLNRIDELIEVFDVIVTSSSIPKSLTELVAPQTNTWFSRLEWSLWANMSYSCKKNVIYGDYTVVSPEYSDANIPPEYMRSRQTPRIIYTELDKGFVTRGGGLKTHGDKQYHDMAAEVVSSGIFRTSYSLGEVYIEDVSKKVLTKTKKGITETICGNASKWIETTVVCHVSFFAKNL